MTSLYHESPFMTGLAACFGLRTVRVGTFIEYNSCKDEMQPVSAIVLFGGKGMGPMRQIMTIMLLLVVMTAGVASATELNLSAATDIDSRQSVAAAAKNVELTLVAVPANLGTYTPDTENELPPELEPALLRERAYTEASAFAGVQVALPTSPLSIVLAADELLNPTYGLTLHLVW
jgi:hypothetical protein